MVELVTYLDDSIFFFHLTCIYCNLLEARHYRGIRHEGPPLSSKSSQSNGWFRYFFSIGNTNSISSSRMCVCARMLMHMHTCVGYVYVCIFCSWQKSCSYGIALFSKAINRTSWPFSWRWRMVIMNAKVELYLVWCAQSPLMCEVGLAICLLSVIAIPTL